MKAIEKALAQNPNYIMTRVSDLITTVTVFKRKKRQNKLSSTPSTETGTSKITNSNNDKKFKKRRNKRSRRKEIDPRLKEQCMEMLREGFTLQQCSRHLRISMRTLRRWQNAKPSRCGGIGRKIVDPYMQMQLLEWYSQQRVIGILPSSHSMRMKALELTTVKSFRASLGWFQKFRAKNNLILDDSKQTKQ
jgi:hypothetical protein